MAQAPNPQQLPYAITSDKVTGANSRAQQQVLMTQARVVPYECDGPYIEPLSLNVGLEQPASIRLARIINLLAPSTPVLCGDLVHFNFSPGAAAAVVTSIDGLTSDPASRYRFRFELTYKAQV